MANSFIKQYVETSSIRKILVFRHVVRRLFFYKLNAHAAPRVQPSSGNFFPLSHKLNEGLSPDKCILGHCYKGTIGFDVPFCHNEVAVLNDNSILGVEQFFADVLARVFIQLFGSRRAIGGVRSSSINCGLLW